MNSARFAEESKKFIATHPEWRLNFDELRLKRSKAEFEADFAILLHPLYLVPVLYFSVMKSELLEDGLVTTRLASIEDITFINCKSEQVISFGENTSSGAIMYFVHPCQTAEFMNQVMAACPNTSYLESWYSFIKQIIKIDEL